MVAAVGSLLSEELVLDLVDYTGEPGKVIIPLGGSTLDTDVALMTADYNTLTRALITATLVKKYPITGLDLSGAPSSSAQGLLAATLALDFQKVNPINAAKTVSKQVLLCAYLDALRDDTQKPHIPVTGNTTLNALTALLAANMDFVAGDGNHYPGSWNYSNGSSKFGTKLTVTDGI